AEVDDIARGLAPVVAVGVRLGVGAIADAEYAAATDPIEGRRRGGLCDHREGGKGGKQSWPRRVPGHAHGRASVGPLRAASLESIGPRRNGAEALPSALTKP